MRVLICGASGFIGNNILNELTSRGHNCIRGVRKPTLPSDIEVNYLLADNASYWDTKLTDIDVVVNAIGVIRDTRKTPMALLHHKAPALLYEACAKAGVKKIINISALGVDSGLPTQYFLSKKAAEEALFQLPKKVHWLNVRPSVVYGIDGSSAKMFRLLASLPIHMLPMGGIQKMQPVHIADLVHAIGEWLDNPKPQNISMDAVGNEVVTMRSMLDSYRKQLNKGEALHINVPGFLIRLSAWMGDYISASPLCKETLAMLEYGNTGELKTFSDLLGKQPLGVSEFLSVQNNEF